MGELQTGLSETLEVRRQLFIFIIFHLPYASLCYIPQEIDYYFVSFDFDIPTTQKPEKQFTKTALALVSELSNIRVHLSQVKCIS